MIGTGKLITRFSTASCSVLLNTFQNSGCPMNCWKYLFHGFAQETP